MRETLIADKVQEIQSELEAWAETTGVLRAGEQLVFSLSIKQHPIVLEDTTANKYWDMTPERFFSERNLFSLGATSSYARRISDRVRNANREWPSGKGPISRNMREFLERYPDRRSLAKIKGIGGTGVSFGEILRVLSDAGLAEY